MNRRLRALVSTTTAALALAGFAACSTVLGIDGNSSDPPFPIGTDDGGQIDGDPNGDGGTLPDGAPNGDGSTSSPGLQLGSLYVTLDPGTVDLLAGDAVPTTFTARVTRPAGDTTPVTIVTPALADVAVTDFPPITASAASTTIAAKAIAPPRSFSIPFVVSAGAFSGTLPLVVRVAHAYRTAGQVTLQTPTPQTYRIAAWGAGGGANGGVPGVAGAGGFVEGDVSILANAQLIVIVGSAGSTTNTGGAPGGGGGGRVNVAGFNSGSGGGYSGAFLNVVTMPNALIIAGAGGGAALPGSGIVQYGGGGGSIGTNAAQNGEGSFPGLGATSTAGGGGGANNAGILLNGGNGLDDASEAGGGGGAGYYGGGGGGVGSAGGGGSSLVPIGGISMPANHAVAGNVGDARRQSAGNAVTAGAVIVTPK